MAGFKIVNQDNGKVLAWNVEMADHFFSRLKGLMFRKSLAESYGMMIKPCNSVHTFFMRFPIDVIFLSADLHVLHIIGNMKPGACSPLVKGSKSVLELPAGIIASSSTQKGHKLAIL